MDRTLSKNTQSSDLEKLAVTLQGETGQTQTEALMEYWPQKKKFTQGAKALAASWGLAIASIFIPVLHFVLVPLFILAGPVAFIFFLRKKTVVVGGEASCPDCGSPVTLHRSTAQWPLKEVCEGEYHHLQVTPTHHSAH